MIRQCTSKCSNTPHTQDALHGKGYIVNIAAHQHGVGYGAWHTVNGFSEAIIDYIREFEAQE